MINAIVSVYLIVAVRVVGNAVVTAITTDVEVQP